MTPDDNKTNPSSETENKITSENVSPTETQSSDKSPSNAELLMQTNEKTKNVVGTRVNFSESSQIKPDATKLTETTATEEKTVKLVSDESAKGNNDAANSDE